MMSGLYPPFASKSMIQHLFPHSGPHDTDTLQVDRLHHLKAHPPALDALDIKSKYVFIVELPGLTADNVDISLHGTTLSIRGTLPPPTSFLAPALQSTVVITERQTGPFERHISVPPGLEEAEIQATMKNGVLVLTFPQKPERDERKAIKVVNGEL